ncbi:MAG: tripartite tricarboxylate transporter substrate binding protein [Rhodoferax sp.]
MNHKTQPQRSLRRTVLTAMAAAAALALSGPAAAQEAWPNKSVKIIVPFSPGGSTDVVARIIGQKLSLLWKEPVVIENRSGAGGNVGAEVTAKAPPDGYTLLMASGSIPTINPLIYKNMAFDPRKDLAAITNVASGPMLVVVPESSSIHSIKELIALAKSKPGTLNFGSAGIGSQVHMAGESFADAAGIDIMHVPYKGESVAYTDLIGNQVQLMVGNIAAAQALLGGGRLRALAVTSKERTQQLPDVPTLAESGLPGFENTGWFGLFAPAGTPPAVLAKVQQDTAKVLGDSQTKQQLAVLGFTPVGDSTADFERAMDSEAKRWAAVVKNRKIQTN